MVLQQLQIDGAQPNETLGLVSEDGKALAIQTAALGSGTSAAVVTYTPAVAANWPVPTPTQVAGALDQIALPRAAEFANGGAIGPAATTTFTTPSVVSTGSGLFMVWGVLNANQSGISTQTGTLLLDGVTTLALALAGTGGAGPFAMSFIAVVSVTPNSSHTFAVRAVASLGTNTIPIGEAKIMVVEMP